jgi:uncharacterized protein YdiU (UPF0061 family)
MIKSLKDLALLADYSLMDGLIPDPHSRADGVDHEHREVFSGHYVPVNPKPLIDPHYVCHSQSLFKDLGFSDELAQSKEFIAMFSGDLSGVPQPLRKLGWATGYALSIYGTEYYQQCPFQTGNGYGDGRAISILEGVFKGKRLEMQLKGGGPTPYCRGADGRAVLRSSVREFLAQEHMHALGVPTSRSLTLYVSGSETVKRPWFSRKAPLQGIQMSMSQSLPPSLLESLRLFFAWDKSNSLLVGPAKTNTHKLYRELEIILLHLIEREYKDSIEESLPLNDKLILLSQLFMDRLTTLVSEWIRVGYCQGNFNSDNCAAGGFTLDYGPFGFIEAYHPHFQPWTGGGHHFAFMNQPVAAERNFLMFTQALRSMLASSPDHLSQLNQVEESFASSDAR